MGALLPLSVAQVRKGYTQIRALNGWTGPVVFVSVSVVLAVILLVAHRRMAAQMAAATCGTSQGVLSPNSATVRVRFVRALCCFSLN